MEVVIPVIQRLRVVFWRETHKEYDRIVFMIAARVLIAIWRKIYEYIYVRQVEKWMAESEWKHFNILKFE